MPCTCPDWEPNIAKVNAPLVLQSVRSGGRYQYDGKPFVFCPWCGKSLTPEVAVASPQFPPGRCQKCGTPTFGSLCAKCKG